MGSIYIERRKLDKGVSLSWDIAHHLYTRQHSGDILVLTKRPQVLLASVRKQWMKVIRGLELERARTLGARRAFELERQIYHMKSIKFVAATKQSSSKADVCFSDYEGSYIELKKAITTLYVTEPVANWRTDIVRRHGLVVIYTDSNLPT